MQINTEFSSPNFSNRTSQIKYIILHYTELSFDKALNCYLDHKVELSPHYLIRKDGKIFNLVQDINVAWHAGKSSWRGLEKLNEYSLGIEIDNLGNEEFPQMQMTACIKLCQYLMQIYQLPKQNIIGHSDIASERKIDPGIFFNWQELAKHNIGIWPEGYDHSHISDAILYQFGDNGSAILELQKKLSRVGYKIDLSSKFDQQTNYVVRAFQSHFYPRLIKNKGLLYYKDDFSKYDWTNSLESILGSLLLTEI